MKVRLLTNYVTREWIAKAGQVVDIPQEQAVALIKAELANLPELAYPPRPAAETPSMPLPETASTRGLAQMGREP